MADKTAPLIVDAVAQDLYGAPDKCGEPVLGDLLLYTVQRPDAAFLDSGRDLPFQPVSGRPLFARIGEKSAVFKLRLPEKLRERRVLFLRLRWKARNKRCTQCDLRNFAAQAGNKRKVFRPGPPPPHELQDPVLAVLERDIEIFDDLRIVAHFGDQGVGDHFRITV